MDNLCRLQATVSDVWQLKAKNSLVALKQHTVNTGVVSQALATQRHQLLSEHLHCPTTNNVEAESTM